MRKLIVTNIVTLDGYCEGPGGDVMGLNMDHAFDAYNAERLRSSSTLLVGRTSYDMFRSFWPRQADNTDPELLDMLADDPDRLAAIREISRRNNAIDKVVISDSLKPEQTDPWRETTRIVARTDARDAVVDLKNRTGQDIQVFGSHTMWNGLLTDGLVDELHLMVAPVMLSGGSPVITAPPDAPLRLLDTRQWQGSDNVLLRYAPRNRPRQ